MEIRDYLCRLLKCSSQCESALVQCQQIKAELELELAEVKGENERLKQIVPPPPPLDYIIERDTGWVQSQLDAMKLSIIRLPLDGNYRFTNRKNFSNIVLWDTTDRLTYVKDFWDCDKFAMLFKIMVSKIFQLSQVAYILDYKSGHSYDLILFSESEPMILEPQNDAMWVWTKRLTDFYSLEGAYVLI